MPPDQWELAAIAEAKALWLLSQATSTLAKVVSQDRLLRKPERRGVLPILEQVRLLLQPSSKRGA